jgi:Protein of unknown function (DUF3300)
MSLLTKATHRVLACLFALSLAMPLWVLAQQPGSAKGFSAEELDQVAAPIALYPDPLVAQILMASTYPLEVVQAARFAKDNASLKGEERNEALKKQTWDDSVKSLVTFPQVLAMMNDKLDWTQKLGDAFLAQQKELMEAVQRLRAKAQVQGNLKSSKEQTVTVEPAAATPPPAPAAPPQSSQTVVVQQAPPTVITIQPTNPQVVYVPTYNPTVVYGAWPYPASPPYAYYPPGYTAAAAAFTFAAGVAVGSALWGNTNWHGNDVNVNVNNYNSYNKSVNTVARPTTLPAQGGNQQSWQHNAEHRKGVQYRDTASQQRYGKTAQPGAQSREAFRGRADQGRQDLAKGGGGQGRQDLAKGGGAQGRQDFSKGGGAQGRQDLAKAGGGQVRQGSQASGQRSGPAAFQGAGGGGAQAKQFSNRGQTSRASSPAASGRTGGGGRSGGGGRR